jgi:pSer/pThr/pTyr-binding forkhead associated (FHA) protein
LQSKKESILTVGWAGSGRLNDNDIGIQEYQTNYISRFHATIEFDEDAGQWCIRDGQWRSKDGVIDWFLSTNGVLVNSQKVNAEGHLIYPGDIITIGDTTLRFEKI